MIDIEKVLIQAKKVSNGLIDLKEETVNQLLLSLSDSIKHRSLFLLEENKKDLNRMDIQSPKYDRLKLTEERLRIISSDLRHIATLASPLGKILEEHNLKNGLSLTKISVPFGVIGVIYESRPNVTIDVFALCLKSANCCVLKGGADAKFSNLAIISLIDEILKSYGVPKEAITLLPSTREATKRLLNAVNQIDLIIPRGSRELVAFVRENARVPIIETGAGIVHTYVDAPVDLLMARDVIFNAKCRRVNVCNALDTLIIHEAHLPFLMDLVTPLEKRKVVLYADIRAFKALNDTYPSELLREAKEKDFGYEFLDYKLSVKTVTSLKEALDHIALYSSKHSEAILSKSEANIALFLSRVDAAVIYVNASTAFTDGAEFGLGAEIGISTQKLHARGPMGLNELTTYKWQARGQGQIRL